MQITEKLRQFKDIIIKISIFHLLLTPGVGNKEDTDLKMSSMHFLNQRNGPMWETVLSLQSKIN